MASRSVVTRCPVGADADTASSHAMARLGSALDVTCVPVGVDEFGQSGSLADVYGAHDLDPGPIVNAALAALDVSTRSQ